MNLFNNFISQFSLRYTENLNLNLKPLSGSLCWTLSEYVWNILTVFVSMKHERSERSAKPFPLGVNHRLERLIGASCLLEALSLYLWACFCSRQLFDFTDVEFNSSAPPLPRVFALHCLYILLPFHKFENILFGCWLMFDMTAVKSHVIFSCWNKKWDFNFSHLFVDFPAGFWAMDWWWRQVSCLTADSLNKADDVIVMSSGSSQLRFGDSCCLTYSQRYNLEVWSLCSPSREGLMKDAIELPCGKCRIQRFWSLTHFRVE